MATRDGRSQPELLGELPPPGYSVQRELVDEAGERELIDHIDSLELTPFRFKGWNAKRLTHQFGWRYDHDVGHLGVAPPMPDWLLPVRDRAARFAKLLPDELVQALLTRYDPGAGIGWHRDRPVYAHIVGISLGAAATMKFRHRRGSSFDRASAPLIPRSVYHLAGPARWEWEHGIDALEQPRWSITFRSFSESGRSDQSSPTL